MTKIIIKPGDEFTLGGKQFVVSASHGDACLAYPAGYPQLEQQFLRRDLGALLGSNSFAFKSGTSLPVSAVVRPSINTLNPVTRKRVQRRLDYVSGFIGLLGATKFLKSKQAVVGSDRWQAAVALTGGKEFYRTRESAAEAARLLQPRIDRLGAFVLTDAHVIELNTDGKPKAKRKPRHGQAKQVVNGQTQVEELEEPSGSTMLDWLSRFEKAAGNWEGLKPQTDRCGNHGPKLAEEVQAIITEVLPTYLTKEAITAERFRENVNAAIQRENDQRKATGEPALTQVAIGAIRRVIDQIDPYFADLCRLDEAVVKARWGWIQDTVQYQVNGQRIEIDAYQTDLVTLLIMSGAWGALSREQRRKIRRERLWLTIAIDSATRVILAMRLSRSPDVPNGIALLDMIESDKAPYSTAVEAETKWSQRTGLCTIVADGGYISAEMRHAVTEARATFENPIAGAAYLRPIVERIFRTVATRLMARLRGKTWSNVVERGDYDSQANASLTEDELAWILVTWVVDIYHQTPHESLGGRTPAQAWQEAEDRYDIRPWRDAHGRRTSFGVRLQRTATEQGVEVLGNYYRDDSAEGLRLLRKVRNAGTSDVMVDIANLGAVSIVIDEVAYTLPARDRRLEGVRAVDWIRTTSQLRRENAASTVLAREIAYRALGRIIDKDKQAAERATIISTVYSATDLDYYEQGLFKRIRYADPVPNEASLPIGETILAIEQDSTSPTDTSPLSTSGDAAAHPAVQSPAKRKSKWSTSK